MLVGWYQTEDEDELSATLFDDLEAMRQHNTVHVLDSTYSVVPLIRDFIRWEGDDLIAAEVLG